MDHSRAQSPWHSGELELQQRVGAAQRMAEVGARVIRNEMPDQHRAFYAQLPFLLAGSLDATGSPWASIIEGPPGFVRSPDAGTLSIVAALAESDPLADLLHEGAPIGLLGIELHTRRRNRINGTVHLRRGGFDVTVQQAFGNCPQYIQQRDFVAADVEATPRGATAEQLVGLDARAQALIRAADTFFVASGIEDPRTGERSVDVSHRGGKPGFVKLDGNRLTIPDFSGNRHFNTLGNLRINPRAGLLFIDFERGDLLQLSGPAEIVFDGPELDAFQGAERLWRVEARSIVRRSAALALRWRYRGQSPKSAATGSWHPADADRL
jgi:predicted pyridoxine 5'-phosphate oxidase superfamily flavin-nucleotide-binding protein